MHTCTYTHTYTHTCVCVCVCVCTQSGKSGAVITPAMGDMKPWSPETSPTRRLLAANFESSNEKDCRLFCTDCVRVGGKENLKSQRSGIIAR